MDNDQDLQEELTTENQSDAKQPFNIKALLRQRWALALIAVLVLIHAGIIGYIRMNGGVTIGYLSPEVTLGEFQFTALHSDAVNQPIERAKLRLHVSLLHSAERKGRILLTLHKNKLQQEIEQLLRQAHGGDFEDPTLAELKRQIQAMINETVGHRIIAEVLITDLSIDRIATETVPMKKKSDKKLDKNWEENRAG